MKQTFAFKYKICDIRHQYIFFIIYELYIIYLLIIEIKNKGQVHKNKMTLAKIKQEIKGHKLN